MIVHAESHGGARDLPRLCHEAGKGWRKEKWFQVIWEAARPPTGMHSVMNLRLQDAGQLVLASRGGL